jgi:hypothetical protein
MKASSLKLLDSTREVVTAKNGVIDPELVKPAVLGMLSHDIETDAAAEDKATTPKAVNDFMSDKLLGLAAQYLTKQEVADVGIYPESAYEATQAKDLNTVTDQCSVVFQGGTGYTNAPFPEGEEAPAFLLRVYAATVDGTSYRTQYLTELTTGKTWVRGYVNQGWGVWVAGDASAGAPRMSFDKDDVQVESTGNDQNAAFVTVTSAYTVIGVLDNEGNQWSLPNGAITTNGAYTRIDVSSILASKNITQADMTGIWYVLFAAGGEGEVTPPVDESRLLPTGGKDGDVLSYQEGVDQGNGEDVFLLLQNELTDSAHGNASPVAVTTQGVTLTGDSNLQFDGNGSYLTAVLPVASIFAADKEWTIDAWIKPVANSSGWNYILTENNGDWGSHSIGLTWNADDQTLEQDTGGYVASVIKASNWPNASTPCAANQWHFIAVEKQKTSSGWSLNYYLNGSPWLQVPFTGDFVPFDSNTPFWFGGNTSDGGRYYKGEANKIRVTAGARYGGKAFAVPDREAAYEPPAGMPVWTAPSGGDIDETIDAKISAHNADSSAHPGKLSLTGGQMTGELKLGSSNGIRFNNADGYGVILRKDASNFFIMITAQDDENGSWTASRPLQLNFATSECNINGGATKDGKGNVITTTYAPLYHPTFSSGIEITSSTPFIDFHYNDSESDYTFRIVQNTADTLTLGGKVSVSNTLSVTSGGLTVAGSITSTGEILSNTTNSFRLIYGDYGAFWRNDGNDLYLMLTDAGNQTGSYNSLRPLTVDFATGVCDISGSALETETNLANTGIYPNVSMYTTQTSDFNTFLTQGVYWFPNGAHPNGPLGDDANCTGVLCVYNVRNTHYVQIFYMRSGTSEGNHIMYYRWRYSETWTNWMTISGNNELATGTSDYNNVTSPGSYYFSYGDNTSNVNAPANGPFHLIVHRYYNAAGTVNRVLQMAIPQIVSTGQTATVYIRTASWDNGAYTWQPWTKLITEDILEAVGVYPTSSVEPNLNFNTALTQGFYFANGANCTNGPFTGASNNQGWVTVRAIPAGNHALQFFYGFNTDDFFVRRYTNNAWASWKRITTNAACTPKVGSAVDCTSALKSSAGYTCPSNGWIYADGIQLNINGGNFYTSRLSMVPVMSGDVVKCSDATIGEFYVAR